MDKPAKPEKPAKPYPEFPLFPHATRRWAKKIRGKMHYFGPWADPDAALNLYLDQKDDLHAGRVPRAPSTGVTVRDLVNHYQTSKKLKLEAGEVTQRSFDDSFKACGMVVEVFGRARVVEDLGPDDFEQLRAKMPKTWGPKTITNRIKLVRAIFNYAREHLRIKPVHFGPAFRPPGKRAMRHARNARGTRLFEPAELLKAFAKANVHMRAMLLLGINCGFGNSDVGNLPMAALDLDGGWVTFPRPKTGIKRRAKLWKETVEAIRGSLAERTTPKNTANDGLVFVTQKGERWAKDIADNPVTKETLKLFRKAGIHRPGLNFYALRHTFETIGGESRDQIATDHVMGHARDMSMATEYRERVSDDRLEAVADHVHKWLFGTAGADKVKPARRASPQEEE